MNIKFNKLFSVILALLLCFGTGLCAFAGNDVSVKINAVVSCSGGVPEKKEKYALRLKSLDTEQELFCEADGEGECTFPELSFGKAGIYNYIVTEEKGNNEACKYDDTVYYLTITVFYDENTYDFDIAAKVLKDGESEKQDEIAFVNVYKEVEEPTENPTEEPVKPTEKTTEEVTENITENVTEKASDTPYTGDTNSVSMWFGLAAIGFMFIAAAVVVLAPKKRYSDEQDT